MFETTRIVALATVLAAAAFAGCLGDEQDASQLGAQQAEYEPEAGAASPDPGTLSSAYRLTGLWGGEPKMGSTSDGTLWVVAHDRMLTSTDGGASWEESWKFASQDDEAPASLVGPDNGVLTNFDPMMAVDPATDRVYFAGMWPALACSHLAWTDDGGDTWTERGPACPLGEMDHQKLVLGPRPDATPAWDGGSYPSVAYLCYSTAAIVAGGDPLPGPKASYSQVRCGTSYDGGTSWTTRTVVADQQTDGCTASLGPADIGPEGTVALSLANRGLCEPARIAFSQDTGISWRMLEPPLDQPARGDDAMIRFGPNGTLWMAYTGVDNRTHVVGTPDLGDTWHGPIDVTPPDVDSTVFNALGVGAEGRLAVAYLGTSGTDAWADDVDGDERWHLHIAAVGDATGDAAVEVEQVTPDEDPVQIGRICMSGATCEGSRNLLDFIGSVVAPNGTFYVSYTEGCVDACAGDPDAGAEDSDATRTAVAWLDGWSLRRRG